MQALRTSSLRAPRSRAGRATIAFGLTALALLGGRATARPNGSTDGRPDQIYVRHARTGEIKIVSGTITTDGIDKIVVDRSGKEAKFDSALVQEVVWGKSSTEFAEGITYFDRKDWENASAKFLLAAGEDEREVVQAAARLYAARALMGWGTQDAAHYSEAASQFDRYIASYSSLREAPLARSLQARNAWLGGDATKAGQQYRALFEEGTGAVPTPGYQLGLCMKAGLQAARALAESGDTLAAREIYGTLNGRARSAAAAAEEGTVERMLFTHLETEAALGPGFVDVVSEQFDQAITFFNGQLTTARSTHDATALYGATYGMALALYGKGEVRKAQLQFATVSALDYTDDDRSAAAKLGLARCYTDLGDAESVPAARGLLTEIVERYGDTPSALTARELLKQ